MYFTIPLLKLYSSELLFPLLYLLFILLLQLFIAFHTNPSHTHVLVSLDYIRFIIRLIFRRSCSGPDVQRRCSCRFTVIAYYLPLKATHAVPIVRYHRV